MKKLEAFMIIKNEEEMLANALDSIRGVDKITICDTGSSDGTFDIYEKHKVNWFKYSKFNTEQYSFKSFSEARNECKQKCTGDWLLYIDGDEVYEPGAVKKLKNMINSQWIKDYDALILEVRTDQDLTHQPRVIRNKPDMWYYGTVHNSLRVFPDGIEGRSEVFPSNRYYQTSVKVKANVSPNHEREPDRSLMLLLEQLKTQPFNDRYLYYIVREWLNRREPIKALYYLNRYFKVAPPTNEAADAYFLAATCHYDLGDQMAAMECAMKAIAILPSFRQAWVMLEGLSHKDWKEYWAHMVKKADNKGVLFVRD